MSNLDDVSSIVHAGLWLVATPIGNLDDISPRAVSVLRAARVICCEDTRHSGKLLAHFGVTGKKLVVINEHTEYDAREEIVSLVTTGSNVALITDAGTPGISDPGERLVRAAVAAGHPVHATPGPVAFVVAAMAIKFFIQFIEKHGFRIWGWYRIVVGILLLLLFTVVFK